MAHLHKAPTWRNSKTKQRAVMFPIWGSAGFVVVVFEYRARIGRNALSAHKSDCLEWIKAHEFA